MIQYQIQYACAYWDEFRNGSLYMVRGKEVGIKPFTTYAEAHRTVRVQMARDRKYGRSHFRYQIVEITYQVVGRFSNG